MGDDPLISYQSGDPNGVEVSLVRSGRAGESLAIKRVVAGLESDDGCGGFQGRVCATKESRTLNKLIPRDHRHHHWSVSTVLYFVILFRGITLYRGVTTGF